MRCPIDGNALSPIEYEGVMILACEECGGELLSGDALSRIVNVREAHFDSEQADLLGDRTPLAGVPSDEARSLTCPLCSGAMSAVNYGGDSGAIVDRCPTCEAVWLDAGELEKIQILMERWQDDAPFQLRAIAGELEHARRTAAAASGARFQGSRFAFVNALINRFLDAA